MIIYDLFLLFFFLFFLLLRSSALCGAVGKCSSCVFIHGIFSSLFSLLFWLVECSIFIFCCHFTLPSNAMRAVCVHTIHTHRAKCCDSACFVHSVEWLCSMVARVVALQCLLCSVVIYNTLFYVLFCKRWIFSSLLFTCVLITYSIRLILLY